MTEQEMRAHALNAALATWPQEFKIMDEADWEKLDFRVSVFMRYIETGENGPVVE